MHKHLSEEDLIELLYGLGPDPSALETCQSCRHRWQSLLERRKEFLERLPQPPEAFLAEQRRSIYRRLEAGRPFGWSLEPAAALATLGVLALGLLLSLPAPERQPTRAANDSQFFTEVYALVESAAPQAAGPIYALFEEQP
jgi:hypothetical protein